MKKIFLIMQIFLLCFFAANIVYGEDTYINIGYIRLINANTIRIKGNVSTPKTLTVMVAGSSNGKYMSDKIIYFNQITPTFGDNNEFTIDLKTAYTIDDNSEYMVRITADNAKEVNEKLLGYELSYGDVDGDFIITANDAALVFAYVLDKGKYPLDEMQLKKAAVSGLKEISAADSACILKKTYDFSYIFPVEG